MNDLDISPAMTYIRKMYMRICKKVPIMRYHKGTVKYLFLEHWCGKYEDPETPRDLDPLATLCKIVKKAGTKFPSAAKAISEDLKDHIPVHLYSTPELCWMSGYFEGSSTQLPALPTTLLEYLELEPHEIECPEFLAAKLEIVIDEVQDLLDALEDEEEEEDDDE